MIIHLPYGKSSISIDLPENYNTSILEPKYPPALKDPDAALRNALRSPLGSPPLNKTVQVKDKVGIIFNDITRPTPSKRILQAVLQEISHVPNEQITLFNALGTHRPNTSDELRQMLGKDVVDNYRVIQNNAFDPSTQVYLGNTLRGHEIWLNREIYNCEIKILTGFIEPHFFAGFSGGGKAIMPGMAGLATILGNHDAAMIGHPQARWGVTWGNPIWEEVHEIASLLKGIFLVNVSLDRNKEMTGIFCGKVDDAHMKGCAFVEQTALIPVNEPFDIIITTNSGYPLDINLYQSVKGMSAAVQVIKQGGTIVIAAECQDGIPQHGLYGQLLREHRSPKELLETILTSTVAQQDQWQAQIQAMIQQKADVYVYSLCLTETQIRSAMLIPTRSIEDTLSEILPKYGPQARICVLPEGPQSIPYIAHHGNL
jgi:nickel-dependent lactate racemase